MATIDVVLPVYNEEHVLVDSVNKLRHFLGENITQEWRIVIANNASTDKTLDVARSLSGEYSDVTYIHLDEKGRGRALRRAWLDSDADILSYMDVDLSTDLETYPLLVRAIGEEFDIAVGSRLMASSQTIRSFKREAISRSYNLLIKAMFFTKFSDAQCGFKAVSHKAAQELVPLIQNQEWFFDSELLILAEKKGYKIKEFPVAWVEDPDTRVNIVKTATEDIKGLLRMRFRPIP